jgi:hypothetical protein
MILALVCAAPAGASPIYEVALDTSSLAGSVDAFAIAFQLLDGDGFQNTSVTIADLAFGAGGSTSGVPVEIGGVSVSPAGVVTMEDAAFFTAFTQAFVPGDRLSFALGFVSAGPAGPTPDSFAMAILLNGVEYPTTHFASQFLVIDFDGAVDIETYEGLPVAGRPYDLSAPVVAPVAEPATLTLVGLGALGLVHVVRRRRQRRH